VSSQGKDNGQVWVWTEQDKGEPARVSLGLLGKARELCQQSGGGEVAAILVGTDSRQMAEKLINHGADKVYLADGSPHLSFDTEICARFMTRIIQTHQPEIILWGATSLGREIASRTAARLETGLTAHCIDLFTEKIEDKNQLVAVVAGWGGNLAIKIICPLKRPQMATVKAGIFIPPQPAVRAPKFFTIVALIVDEGGKLRIAHGCPRDFERINRDRMAPLFVIKQKWSIFGTAKQPCAAGYLNESITWAVFNTA